MSRTAEGAAAVRAAHSLRGTPPLVIDDSLAIHFTSAAWRWIIRCNPLYRILIRGPLKKKSGIFGNVIARSRLTEDELQKARKEGTAQFVILGAGFDTFAYRHSDLGNLKIFELDHPFTQDAKKARLTMHGVEIPPNVRFLPIDFSKQSVTDVLSDPNSGFNPDLPAFFSWLGVTVYLEKPVIESLFRSLKELCRGGAKLTFDYVDSAVLNGTPTPTMKAIMRYAKNRGEPFRSGFTPNEIQELLSRVGWSLRSNLTPDDQNRLYFQERADGLRATEQAHLALAETTR